MLVTDFISLEEAAFHPILRLAVLSCSDQRRFYRAFSNAAFFRR
jgi:hypothetical protein